MAKKNTKKCAYCSGTGKYLMSPCPVCKGKGWNKI